MSDTVTWPTDDSSATVLDRAVEATHLLVALDFDGTLSPLADQPLDARATPESIAAVAALAAAPDTTVAFVSGRSLPDLRHIAEHADDSPVLLAGSHGAEYWFPDAVRPDETAAGSAEDSSADIALRDELREAAVAGTASFDGVWIEPKSFGFGVHTRLSTPDDERTVQALTDALIADRAPSWRRRSGHNIVEYSFRQEGKDAAIAALREHTGATSVLFAGDDVTDEDALRALGAGDVGVRVGSAETAAALRVADIQELAGLLSALARMRTDARQ